MQVFDLPVLTHHADQIPFGERVIEVPDEHPRRFRVLCVPRGSRTGHPAFQFLFIDSLDLTDRIHRNDYDDLSSLGLVEVMFASVDSVSGRQTCHSIHKHPHDTEANTTRGGYYGTRISPIKSRTY